VIGNADELGLRVLDRRPMAAFAPSFAPPSGKTWQAPRNLSFSTFCKNLLVLLWSLAAIGACLLCESAAARIWHEFFDPLCDLSHM